LARQAGSVFRTVPVTPRSAQNAVKARGRHPERTERLATLHVRWGAVTLPRRQYSATRAATVTMHAVHVVEPAPPAGEAAIEWMLVTSEQVQDLEAATAVVDHYRARWIIEEYFKALKTGCAFEKRQLTSLTALLRALALFVPMAWRLLVLRHLGRAAARTPISQLFDAEQVLLLRQLLKRRGYQLTLPRVVLWSRTYSRFHAPSYGRVPTSTATE
jgi:IS4 transposase